MYQWRTVPCDTHSYTHHCNTRSLLAVCMYVSCIVMWCEGVRVTVKCFGSVCVILYVCVSVCLCAFGIYMFVCVPIHSRQKQKASTRLYVFSSFFGEKNVLFVYWLLLFSCVVVWMHQFNSLCLKLEIRRPPFGAATCVVAGSIRQHFFFPEFFFFL